MRRPRGNHVPAFKAGVVTEALKREKAVGELPSSMTCNRAR
jgi:hypothetical protein